MVGSLALSLGCPGFRSRATHTVHILQSLHQQLHQIKYTHELLYKTPTCFNTEVPSSGGYSIQRIVDATYQSSYVCMYVCIPI